MADEKLNPRHRWALLALMALGGELSNPDLRKRTGIDMKKGERERLIAEGYLTSEKQGSSYHHELTDAGRDWCEAELSSGWTAGHGSADGALYAVLGFVSRYLTHTGQSLGEFSRKAAATTGTVEDQIRAAYRQLATRPGKWVSLTELRPLLNGFDRSEVDEALRQLDRTPQAHLTQEANPKALTQADRRAAVRIGGEDKHAILIEEA